MLISVVIPVFNTNMRLFLECIKSIYRQTHNDIEIIVVDNNSSEPFAKNYKMASNKYGARYVLEKKQGVSAARNRGIAESRGKYIIFVDSDDFIRPTHIEGMVKKIKKYSADIVFSDHSIIGSKNKIGPSKDINYDNQSDMIRDLVLSSEKYVLTGTAFRESIAKTVSFKEMKYGEDLDYVFNAALKAEKISVINDPTYCYRINPDGVTKNAGYDTAEKHYSDAIKLYDSYEKVCPDLINKIKVARFKKMQESLTYIINDVHSSYVEYKAFFKKYINDVKNAKVIDIIKSPYDRAHTLYLLLLKFRAAYICYRLSKKRSTQGA